jgi:hypothetical protein
VSESDPGISPDCSQDPAGCTGICELIVKSDAVIGLADDDRQILCSTRGAKLFQTNLKGYTMYTGSDLPEYNNITFRL